MRLSERHIYLIIEKENYAGREELLSEILSLSSMETISSGIRFNKEYFVGNTHDTYLLICSLHVPKTTYRINVSSIWFYNNLL